jgi:hypothetical protein
MRSAGTFQTYSRLPFQALLFFHKLRMNLPALQYAVIHLRAFQVATRGIYQSDIL